MDNEDVAYGMEYCSATKGGANVYVTTQTDLEGIMLSEINQVLYENTNII